MIQKNKEWQFFFSSCNPFKTVPLSTGEDSHQNMKSEMFLCPVCSCTGTYRQVIYKVLNCSSLLFICSKNVKEKSAV